MDSPPKRGLQDAKHYKLLVAFIFVAIAGFTVADVVRHLHKQEEDERPANAPLPLRPSTQTAPTTAPASQ
jgi:hypothetical protein